MPNQHEQYASSMKAQPQRRPMQSAMLVERAQRVMHEFRKLLEQREAQLNQIERFLGGPNLLSLRKTDFLSVSKTLVTAHSR